MIEIFKRKTNINFTKAFVPSALTSSVLILISLGMILFGQGLNYGVDFRGGAEVQVKFFEPVTSSQVRDALTQASISASVQNIGELSENEYLIKVLTQGDLNQASNNVKVALEKKFPQTKQEIRKTDIVGPKAGKQLRTSAVLAMVWAMIAIMIYVGLRFDIRYAPGAVLALVHDVIITAGVFAVTGKEFTLQIVAALLAIIGYSVNDTVIVYDRVRENEMKSSGEGLEILINRAINETMSRTALTSGATLLVCILMYFLGGKSIEDFFFAMSVGIIVGTYSSIYIAAPITLIIDRFRAKKTSTRKLA